MKVINWLGWIIGYGAIFVLTDYFSKLIGVNYCISSFAILVYSVIFLIYVEKRDKVGCEGEYLGIKLRLKASNLLIFIPVLILPIFNIVALNNIYNPFQIILFVGVAIVEELIFRKFLLVLLKNKLGIVSGVLISSLLFALMHTVNLLQGLDLLFICMQICCSFAVGVIFCLFTLKSNSLLPSVIAHFVINLFGVGSIAISRLWWAISLGIICLAYLCYALIFLLVYKKTALKEKS